MNVSIINHTTGKVRIESFSKDWEATSYVDILNEEAEENIYSWEYIENQSQ
jgi:hypothetical protein